MNYIINLFLLFLFFLLSDDRKEPEEPSIKEILIEKHSEGFYAWMKDTNTFVAQGKTPEELFALIREKFPKLDIKLIAS
jgi:hypothetical protein